MIKKVILCFILICLFSLILTVSVSAHDSDFGIPGYNDYYYDECVEDHYVNSSDIGDSIDEKWYELIWGNIDYSVTPNVFDSFAMFHIDDDITTLYYQFQDNGLTQPNTTWYTNVGVTNGDNIKEAYENSMLKWNDVLFYKKNGNLYEKHNIIKLVNYDSLTDKQGVTPNIFIYPYYSTGDFTAQTSWIYDTEVVNDKHKTNGVWHRHFTQFNMEVNLYFLNNNEVFKNRTGAHELGHVLGLFDIDTVENPNQSSSYHHEEILMGYAKNSNGDTRQSEITYKDIAGVSIIRGLHTDTEHKWMTDGLLTVSGIKLICSICNCIKYVTSLDGYEYVQLGSCNNNHSLYSDNMMPVASYGTKDYYKCKYCRYVAPFTAIIQQNYSYASVDYYNHIVSNNVAGLQYDFLEKHTNSVSCDKCDFTHSHNYNLNARWINTKNHIAYCVCGGTQLQGHAVLQGTTTCVVCGGKAEMGFIGINSNAINLVTENGSYVLFNGITILVLDDLESYLNGTLVFYNKNDISVVQ